MAASVPRPGLAAQAEKAEGLEKMSSQTGMTRNKRTVNIKKDKNKKHVQL